MDVKICPDFYFQEGTFFIIIIFPYLKSIWSLRWLVPCLKWIELGCLLLFGVASKSNLALNTIYIVFYHFGKQF